MSKPRKRPAPVPAEAPKTPAELFCKNDKVMLLQPLPRWLAATLHDAPVMGEIHCVKRSLRFEDGNNYLVLVGVGSRRGRAAPWLPAELFVVVCQGLRRIRTS